MTRPKILMFGWEFPPYNSGGLGTACQGIVRALVARKLPVIFVLPRRLPINQVGAEFLFADLPYVETESVDALLYPYITSEGYSDLQVINPGPYGRNLLDEVRRYGRLAGHLARRHQFDIIHAHDWLTYPAGLAARAATGRPLVVHVHATEFDRTGNGAVNSEVYEIERQGMTQADGIVAISQWTKDIVTKHYGIPADKVEVVHNGIEAEDYPPAKPALAELKAGGNKLVLFLGRLTLQKGPDYFLRAAKRVLAVNPKTFFVMAGSGDMERQCIRQATELGIADRVIFAGFVRGEELTRLYQAADLYVMPSVSEPFGLTPLEAAAQGIPVLISKQSGVSEVFHSALKADFWDIEEMSNQITAALRYSSLHQELAQGGRDRVRDLSWHRSVAGYLTYYQKILTSRMA